MRLARVSPAPDPPNLWLRRFLDARKLAKYALGARAGGAGVSPEQVCRTCGPTGSLTRWSTKEKPDDGSLQPHTCGRLDFQERLIAKETEVETFDRLYALCNPDRVDRRGKRAKRLAAQALTRGEA